MIAWVVAVAAEAEGFGQWGQGAYGTGVGAAGGGVEGEGLVDGGVDEGALPDEEAVTVGVCLPGAVGVERIEGG